MSRISISNERRLEYCRDLEPGDYVIGRDHDVDIHLDLPSISRHHARLTVGHGGLWIADLGSASGTYLENREVGRDPTPFKPGQLVGLGTLCLRVDEDSAAARPRVCGDLPVRDDYEVGVLIAHGGMGNVLAAVQTAMRREVAMKVIRGDATPSAVGRFLEEARVTGSLEHPNIVPVHEIAADAGGGVFYTMKYVRGNTLAEIFHGLRAKTPNLAREFNLARLLTVFQKVCDAVALAHSKGIIHRDLKPENIMVGDFGEVLVMDWGLAKFIRRNPPPESAAAVMDGDTDAGATLDGDILGTPQYMAPEQARGEIAQLDERSDIYALGAILYEMLHLKPAVAPGTKHEVIIRVAKGVMDKPPGGKQPHLPAGAVPKGLRAVCRKAMALERARRYSTVKSLQADVAAFQSGRAPSAQKAGPLIRLALVVRRNQGVAAAIGLALCALALLSIAYAGDLLRQRNKAETARREAVQEREKTKEALGETRIQKTVAESAQQAAEAHLKNFQQARAAALGLSDKHKASLDRVNQLVAAGPDADQLLALLHIFDVLNGDIGKAQAKIDLAITRNPNNPELLVARGRLRQVTGRFREAQTDFRTALTLSPAPQVRQDAQQSLEATDELIEASKQRLDESEIKRKLKELLAKTEEFKAFPLDDVFTLEPLADDLADVPQAPTVYSPEEARLVNELNLDKMAGWTRQRIRDTGNGRFHLDLNGLQVGSLASLKGRGIVSLNLANTACTDLSGLQGIRLESLNLANTKIDDIRQLKGMPLRDFDCSGTAVTDFTALAGRSLEVLRCENRTAGELIGVGRLATLRELHAGGDKLVDLAPLKGLKLKVLRVTGSGVTDLTPLVGMPVETLHLDGCPTASLKGLENLPELRELALPGTNNLKDFRILGTLARLETLILPKHACGLSCLEALKHLKIVDHPRFGGRMEAARFVPLAIASDNAWRVIYPLLAGTGATDLRPDRLTMLQHKEIDLDLRGTNIRDLRPLANVPICRLYLDTQDPGLDVAPLGRIPGLRHLCITGLTVPQLAPLQPESPECKLESIAINRAVADIHRFGFCKSIKWIGYDWDEGQRRASTPRDDFFAKRTAQSGDPDGKAGKPVAITRFDEFGRGLEEWIVTPVGAAGIASAWRPDTLPAVNSRTARGGGFFSVAGPAPADGQVWFVAPRSFLGNQSRVVGGGIEFHLRREGLESTPGVPDVELVSGQMRLVQVLNLPKLSGWQIVLLRLDAAGAWSVGSANGPQATSAQLRDVLANLTGFHIRASHSPNPGQATGLDDVVWWDRDAFARRVANIAKLERLFYEATKWAAAAEITPPPDQAWLPDYPKVLFEHGVPWAAEYEGRHGVLLTHPLSQELPATVKLLSTPAPADDLEFVVSARARMPKDGSRLVIKSKDKTVFEGQVGGAWRDIRIPATEFAREEPAIIEIHPIGWNSETCFIHQPRWVRSRVLIPTAEQGGDKWAYTTTDPGAGWETAAFDDSGWELGTGAFAQRAGGADPLRRTPWQSGGIWLRRVFQSDAVPDGNLTLRICHDEDARVYLNDSVIKEIPGSNTSYANHLVPATTLRKGRNVLAIHCKHSTGDQIIDAGLTHEVPVGAADQAPTPP